MNGGSAQLPNRIELDWLALKVCTAHLLSLRPLGHYSLKEWRFHPIPFRGVGMKAPIGPGTPVCIGGSLERIRFRQCLHNRLASIAVPSRMVA